MITAGMASQGIARLLYTVAIGRFAAPGALGDTSTLLSVAVYLSLLLPAGLATAASRYLPLHELRGAAIRILNRWFWVASSALALAAIPLALVLTHDAASAIGCALLVWSYNAYVYTRGVLMGEDRILRSMIGDFVSGAVAITALIAVLTTGATWALLLPLALGYALFAFVARPRTIPLHPSAKDKVAVTRFVIDATVGALATGGLLPATMIFVRAFDTLNHADLFAAALSLATPASMVSQAVNQVLIPHFARLSIDPTALRQSHRRMLIATSALFVVVFGAAIALTPVILPLIYGERFADGVGAMQVLLTVVFFISATCAPSALLVTTGRQRSFAVIWLIALLVGTGVMVTLSPSFGMWGALAGFAAGGIGGSMSIIVVGLVPFSRCAVRADASRSEQDEPGSAPGTL